MAAIVEIDEANGAGETLTHNIANSNMGSVDAAALDPVVYPVIPGENTFEKYQKFHVTNMGGSSLIDNLKVWRTGALGGAATHKTSAKTTSYVVPSYATPAATVSTKAINAMPTSVPATANVGIGGSLTGGITVAGSSDYIVQQIQTNVADVAGSTSTMHYQYDETA